jgi:hypothetical protein
MTTFFTRVSILFIGAWSLAHLQAQDSYTAWWQPQVGINYNVSPRYAQNFAVANRNFIYEGNDLKLKGRHLDLSHFSTLTIGLEQNLGLGVLYRFRKSFDTDDFDELRFMQSFNISVRPSAIRFGHRFLSEQRILPFITVHRFRYRFTIDFPLEGENVDLGEWYLILNTESLLSVAKNQGPQYDQRFMLTLGHLLTEQLRFLAGFEYRFNDYSEKTRNAGFLMTTLVISL